MTKAAVCLALAVMALALQARAGEIAEPEA